MNFSTNDSFDKNNIKIFSAELVQEHVIFLMCVNVKNYSYLGNIYFKVDYLKKLDKCEE